MAELIYYTLPCQGDARQIVTPKRALISDMSPDAAQCLHRLLTTGRLRQLGALYLEDALEHVQATIASFRWYPAQNTCSTVGPIFAYIDRFVPRCEHVITRIDVFGE